MKVGKYTYGAEFIKVKEWGEGAILTIGSFCSIAGGIEIFLGGNHRTDWITTYPFGHVYQNTFNSFSGEGHPSTKGDVIIGNDVWIGDGATIMSGVTIGNGAVIAAKSLIVKDVPPYSIVGGNPGRIIRYRFDENTIKTLEELAWWTLPDNIINSLTPYLCSNNTKQVIELLKKLK